MSGIFDFTSNYSLYAIPAAWVVAMAPHVVTLTTAKSVDKTAPRTYAACLAKDQTLDSATKAMVIRAEGAQTNGFENLGLFAAAILAGNFAGLPNETLNLLSGGYVASRVLYNLIYINHTTEVGAAARTVTFFTGLGFVMTLFVKSGNAIRERALL